jgi:hypothetical protein
MSCFYFMLQLRVIQFFFTTKTENYDYPGKRQLQENIKLYFLFHNNYYEHFLFKNDIKSDLKNRLTFEMAAIPFVLLAKHRGL